MNPIKTLLGVAHQLLWPIFDLPVCYGLYSISHIDSRLIPECKPVKNLLLGALMQHVNTLLRMCSPTSLTYIWPSLWPISGLSFLKGIISTWQSDASYQYLAWDCSPSSLTYIWPWAQHIGYQSGGDNENRGHVFVAYLQQGRKQFWLSWLIFPAHSYCKCTYSPSNKLLYFFLKL